MPEPKITVSAEEVKTCVKNLDQKNFAFPVIVYNHVFMIYYTYLRKQPVTVILPDKASLFMYQTMDGHRAEKQVRLELREVLKDLGVKE